MLAEIEWRLGNGARSADLLRERLRLWPSQPEELYRGAGELARAASVADGNDRARALNDALAALEQAVAAGFNDLPRLRADGNLELLRTRADFRMLVDKLDQKLLRQAAKP
jgi:hypothetical protein